ncbi:MAG: TlpA family protein disulfide reductase [Longimicrobiales bacterium]
MTPRLRSWLVPAAAVIALAALVALGWAQRGRYTPVDVGDEIPSYTAPMLSGERIGLDSFRGRVVLLNVWATWCAPCRFEMPALQRLHERLGPRGLEVVAVSVDQAAGNRALVERFVEAHELTFTVLLDPEGRVRRRFAVAGLPTTFVIDRTGTVRERVLGGREWDRGEVARRIEALLEEGV